MTVGLTLFGAPTITCGGQSIALRFKRRTQLLVYLALKRSWVARAELTALLWPDLNSKLASTNLRKALHRLQGLPGAGRIEVQPGALRFEARTDVQDFEAALREQRIGEALELHHGPWLFADDPGAGALQEILAVSDAVERHVQRGEVHAAAAVFVDYWSGPGAWEQLLPSRQDAIAARMRAVQPHFGALYREDFVRIRALAGRSLVYVTGTATAAATRRLGALARNALPCALHEELAGAGHMGPITHEAEFNARIEQFLVALAAPEIASRRKVAWDRWCRRASADAMLSSSAAEA